MRSKSFALLVGVWLASLQFSLFLSLQLLLSSAYVTYAIVIVSWIIGGALGVWIPPGRFSRILILMAGTTPYLSFWILAAFPYDTGTLAVHSLLVTITALYGGHFFQHFRHGFSRIGDLFFWENNGFILGLLVSLAGYIFWGRDFLQASPIIAMLPVLVMDFSGHNYPPVSPTSTDDAED